MISDVIVFCEKRLLLCRPSNCADDLVSAEKGKVLLCEKGTRGTSESLMKRPSMILVIQYSPIEQSIYSFDFLNYNKHQARPKQLPNAYL